MSLNSPSILYLCKRYGKPLLLELNSAILNRETEINFAIKHDTYSRRFKVNI